MGGPLTGHRAADCLGGLGQVGQGGQLGQEGTPLACSGSFARPFGGRSADDAHAHRSGLGPYADLNCDLGFRAYNTGVQGV